MTQTLGIADQQLLKYAKRGHRQPQLQLEDLNPFAM